MSIIDRLLKFAGKDNFQLDSTIGRIYLATMLEIRLDDGAWKILFYRI